MQGLGGAGREDSTETEYSQEGDLGASFVSSALGAFTIGEKLEVDSGGFWSFIGDSTSGLAMRFSFSAIKSILLGGVWFLEFGDVDLGTLFSLSLRVFTVCMKSAFIL